MTNARRPEGGYRGALPPRQDTLARPWVVAVIAIFLLIFVLAIAGLPSRFIAEPSPNLSGAPSASASGGPAASGQPSGSAGPSASP